MTHKVTREVGKALDLVIKEFGLGATKDIPLKLGDWRDEFEPLRSVSLHQFHQYVREGYEYPKTKQEAVEHLCEWVADYDQHSPAYTKNSMYRRGRRNVLNEVLIKMQELGLIEEENEESGIGKKQIRMKENFFQNGELALRDGMLYRVFSNGTTSHRNEFVLSDQGQGLFLYGLKANFDELT